MNNLVIAIDGPAGAGKSTIAKLVAARLGYVYVDTGSMYRAIAWKVLEENVSVDDESAVTDMAKSINIELKNKKDYGQVMVNSIDVTDAIREPGVTKIVSKIAGYQGVRDALLSLQRNMATAGGVVMDGRDIGSFVLPQADVKIFLTASIEARARRRWLEMKAQGYAMEFKTVMQDMEMRDKADFTRKIAPLVVAENAVLIDSTDLTIESTVDAILNLCKEK